MSRSDSLPDLLQRIIAARSEGVSRAVKVDDAEYEDPRMDEVVRLESLAEFLDEVRQAAPLAKDLQALMRMVDATDGETSASLSRVEQVLRATLQIVPDLTPTVVKTLELSPRHQRMIDGMVERGEVGSASELLTKAVRYAIGEELEGHGGERSEDDTAAPPVDL
jgi:hypothetical protein